MASTIFLDGAWVRFFRMAVRPLVMLLPTVVVGCTGTGTTARHSLARPVYVANFTATRLKDHSPLASASLPLVLDQKATLHLHPAKPTEETPVFKAYTATLKTAGAPQTQAEPTRRGGVAADSSG